VARERVPRGAHVVPGDLGDHDDVGPTGDRRRQSQLAGRPPHDLDDEHALEGGRRVADAEDGVEHGVERRVEPDRDVGAADVVVDRRGDPHDLDALLNEGVAAGQRAVAADDDEALDTEPVERRDRPTLARRRCELLAPRRPEEGPTAIEDAAHGTTLESDHVALHEPAKAPVEADHPALLEDRPPRNGAHGGVHAG